MATMKTFSDAQEKMVALFLDWSQVSGSGARPTVTGDVQSDEWLGECKTHATPGHKINFVISVWDKIKDEAAAKFKQAAYFVDDGTQRSWHTWVMFSDRLFVQDVEILNYPLKVNKSGISFEYNSLLRDSLYYVYKLKFGDSQVMIATLDIFSQVVR